MHTIDCTGCYAGSSAYYQWAAIAGVDGTYTATLQSDPSLTASCVYEATFTTAIDVDFYDAGDLDCDTFDQTTRYVQGVATIHYNQDDGLVTFVGLEIDDTDATTPSIGGQSTHAWSPSGKGLGDTIDQTELLTTDCSTGIWRTSGGTVVVDAA